MDRAGFGLVLLCFCVGVPRALGQNYVNVATRKTYSQVSKHLDQRPPSNAANGDTGGVYSASNCIHTKVYGAYPNVYYDTDPWWQVDLGRTYPVYSIKVWARTGFIKRLYPFTITVDGQQCATVTSMSSRSVSVTCSSGVMYGQVVRLTRTGSDQPLNLCEFQIFECKEGFYGTNCNQTCDWHCQGGCNRTTSFCTSCPSGFYGSQHCYQRCSTRCAGSTCDRNTGKCSGCQAGWYGDTCNTTCPSNCLNNECNQKTGLCTACAGNFAGDYCTACKEGFHGNNCDQNCDWHCQGGCDKTTNVCTSCKAGFYGQYRCQQSCSASCDRTCQRVNGYCDACKPGYRGNKCQLACSDLSPGCAQCTQYGQTCTRCKAGFASPSCTECQDGYYEQGAQCLQCSYYCAMSYSCNKLTGKCDGCKDGYHGDKCSETCSPSGWCQRCDQDSGLCSACHSNLTPPSCSECLDGFYKRYSSSISCTSCTWQCYNDTACDKRTGNCDRCPPGKSGNRCGQPCEWRKYGQDCSESCGHCRNNYACDVVSGACNGCVAGFQPPLCKTDCENGTYGADCGQTCGHCKDGTACEKVSGQCPLCDPGWYQSMCKTPCPDGYYGVNCTQPCGTCLNGAVCNKTDGHCSSCPIGKQPPLCDTECQENTYGQICSGVCGHCKGGQPCDTKTGDCTSGCEPGYKGQNCQTECPPGYYGDGCNKTCGNCLEKSMCRHDTGQCQSGCAQGFTGNLCVQAQVQDGPSGDVATVAGGTVAGILVIAAIVAVVIIFVMRRRRRGSKSGGHNDMPAEMWNSREGLNDRQDPHASTSPLSFASAASDEAKARPTVQVKPTVKPAVPSKPTQAANSNGAIYENISILQQKPKPEPTPSTSPGKPDSDKTKTSPKLNGVKVKTATNSKGKPLKPSKPGEGKESRSGGETPPQPLTDDEEIILSGAKDAVYANEETYSNIAPTNIRLDMLQKTVVDKLRDGKLAEEFSRLVPNKDYPVTNGQRDENYYKNRFNSILPYDKNRVELEKVDGDDASDYVNASFVKGHKSEKAYIATQGPKVNTQDDFWRMVWQERVTDIVILTNTMEGSKGKCYKYWPSEGATLNTGHMEVTGVEEEGRAHFLIRTFDLRQLKGKEKLRVKQYHYISWMDHEVPATTPLVNFWRYIRARAPRSASATPLLVHCSAGVGRTGTYIALDIIMDHAEQQNTEINIYNIVDKLREDRCHMVQNKSQYEFLHEAVLEAYSSRDTRMEAAAFDSAFPHTIRHDAPHQRIDAEFETLTKMRNCLTHRTYTTATQEENRAKNRNPNALPDDKHLVFLTQHVKGRSQFISAVFMPTFEEPRGSIMTQLPLPDTLMDLWRLVDGCGSDTIVSIGEVDGGKDMCRYWPKDKETIKTGSYTISLESMAKIGECLFSYSVTMQRDDKSRAVRVLHYAGWTGEVADNASDLIHLLTTLQSSHKERDGKPVIVQCIDGVARSGVVCALWEVISRLTCDGEVDIYLAVRQVHSVRPEAIASVEQYRYCYEMIQQFRNSQSIYANT